MQLPARNLGPAPVQGWDLALATLSAPACHLLGPESEHLNPRTAVSCSSGLNRGANSKCYLVAFVGCSRALKEFEVLHLVARCLLGPDAVAIWSPSASPSPRMMGNVHVHPPS